jgi:ABC-type sugar transport system substrate-binding protein
MTIPPLGNPPPAGVKVEVISCKLPECLIAEPGYEAAAKVLNWNLTLQRSDLTTEAIAAAWTKAVADKPKAILAYSLGPDEIVKPKTDQAQEEGIPVILGSTPVNVGEQGVDATISSRPVWEAGTAALSDWVIADSAGKAKAVVIHDGAYPLQVAAFKAAQTEMQKLCSECEIEGLEVRVMQVCKGIPGQVVSHLQKNPDVGYVLSPLSSPVLGVGPAVKSAGRPAKVATAWAQPNDFAAIKSGTQAAGVSLESLTGV